MREMIFSEMSTEWKECYEAGIFTEFMEQRAPGHTVLDDKIYHKGFLDLKKDIQKSLRSLDFLSDAQAYAKKQELLAMDICADALRFMVISDGVLGVVGDRQDVHGRVVREKRHIGEFF